MVGNAQADRTVVFALGPVLQFRRLWRKVKVMPKLPDLVAQTPEQKDDLIRALYRRLVELEGRVSASPTASNRGSHQF